MSRSAAIQPGGLLAALCGRLRVAAAVGGTNWAKPSERRRKRKGKGGLLCENGERLCVCVRGERPPGRQSPDGPTRHCNLGKASVLAPGGRGSERPQPSCSPARSRAAGTSRALPPLMLVPERSGPANRYRRLTLQRQRENPRSGRDPAPGPKPQRCEEPAPPARAMLPCGPPSAPKHASPVQGCGQVRLGDSPEPRPACHLCGNWPGAPSRSRWQSN